ncbi:hypothetical protein QAD02_022162 [Eretmocerus hayati]|uniref:Uncharacterized protein n=1 Tax=Eretmocerus hayati TaxID=131215 RepID=A0ACC2PTR2_9HYME|nr:hypothetical protein QAD02_022162 [Eretmocerus hayati]
MNAASGRAGIVATVAVAAASRDAASGNATQPIADAASGLAALRLVASRNAALGVAPYQDASTDAANDGVLSLGIHSVSTGVRRVTGEPLHDLGVQHLADELHQCSRDLIAGRPDFEER